MSAVFSIWLNFEFHVFHAFHRIFTVYSNLALNISPEAHWTRIGPGPLGHGWFHDCRRE